MLAGFTGLPLSMILLGAGFLLCANLLFCVILGEVNGKDPSHQISPWFVNVRYGYVLRRHAELFPTSKRRAQMNRSMIAGFLLAFVGLLVAIIRANKAL